MRKLAALALVARLLAVAPLATPAVGPASRRPPRPPARSSRRRRPVAVKVIDDCVAVGPRPGHHHAGPDLLLALQARRRHAPAPGPDDLHSHGWGGSRTTDPAAFATLLDAGYGVLSFDQRGFGESGGHAYVENPAVEGKDVPRARPS